MISATTTDNAAPPPSAQDLQQSDATIEDPANSDSNPAKGVHLLKPDAASSGSPQGKTEPAPLDTTSRLEEDESADSRRKPAKPPGNLMEMLPPLTLPPSAQGKSVPPRKTDPTLFVQDDAHAAQESEENTTGSGDAGAAPPSSPPLHVDPESAINPVVPASPVGDHDLPDPTSPPPQQLPHSNGSAPPPPPPPPDDEATAHSPSPPSSHSPHSGQSASPSLRGDFWRRAKHLAKWLPHIQPVVRDYSRNPQAGRIFCYDYFDGEELPHLNSSTIIEDIDPKNPEFPRLNWIENGDVTKRLILVEDLVPFVILALGELFDIDPEFFAEHLNRSGYHEDSYEEDLPREWITRNFERTWSSLKWYRPVFQSHRVAKTLNDRLKDRSRCKRAGKTFDEGRIEPWPEVRYSAKPQRRKKKGEKDEEEKDSEDENQDKKGDEKADGKGGKERNSKDLIERTIYHNWRVKTNIFRQEWLLSTRPDDPGERRVSAAWEERASLFIYNEAKVPIMILLLDPMPKIVDHQEIKSTKIQWSGIFKRHASDSDDSDTELSTSTENVKAYRSVIPRQPLSLAPPPVGDNAPHLRDWSQNLQLRVKKTCPTVDDLQSWLMHKYPQNRDPVVTDPIFDLLHIIHLDTMAFLDKLDSCLHEIGQESLDDYLMDKRIIYWRTLMNEFENHVPEIRRSLESFVNFAYRNDGKIPDTSQHLIDELNHRVEKFEERLEDAYTALRADLSILESKRNIAEAENVTKLTELAFAFIPVTFACSLLTMPLLVLQDRVPLQTFILTALILALLSYGIRLVIRSDLIEVNRRRALEAIWKSADLKQGSKISTHILVFRTAKEIWNHRGPVLTFSLFLTILSISIVPIAFLWTRTRLDGGFNVVITLLIIPFGAAVAWLFTSSTANYERGSGIPLWYRPAIWLSHHIPKRKARRRTREIVFYSEA